MKTEKELQDAVEYARKRLEAAKWMKLHGVPRIDKVPHYVAVRLLDDQLVCCELDLIHHEWSKQP